MLICYLLTCCETGDTYIGVTGQGLGRRIKQHVREGKMPGEFTARVLAQRKTRPEINAVERKLIAALSPTLNRIKGGTSTSGYAARRGVERQPVARVAATHCIRGHEFTSDNTGWSGGTRYCRTCGRNRNRAWMKHKYGIGRGADVDNRGDWDHSLIRHKRGR